MRSPQGAVAAAVALLIAGICHLAMGQETLEGKTLKVVTILNDPFVMRDEASETGGYKGYYIDLLQLLQRELKFKYELYEVADGSYGKLVDGKWVGMVGDVVDKKANFTLATLRITSSRMKAVDFTVPVSASGMSILFKRPKSLGSRQMMASPALVAKPFAPSTWILLLLLYVIYAGLAFAIWLVSPYELNRRSLADAATVEKARKAGCGAWLFVTGGLFLQGFARAPKSPAARVLAFAWWLFALANVCCYAANLVPLVTQLRASQASRLPIGSLRDLVQQTAMPYGAIRGGATQKMLEESTLRDFQVAFSYLSSNPHNYANTTVQAIDRVQRGNYAWISEGVTAEYYAMSMCELASVSAGLSSLDFGLAVAKGSELKSALDAAILKVKTNGELGSLRGRWWAPPGGPCADNDDGLSARPAAGASVAGLLPGDLTCLYALLLVGAVAALATLPVELRLRAGAADPAGNATACGGGRQAEEPAGSQKEDAGGATAAAAASPTANVEAKKAAESPPPESRPLV